MNIQSFSNKNIAGYTLCLFFLLFILVPALAQNEEASQGDQGIDQAQQGQNVQGSDPQASNQIPADEQSVTNGTTLFRQHCNACHMVDKQIIGPALASVHNRRPVEWLVAFIRNSEYVINETDDEYAQHLYEQYNRVVMPSFEFLSDDDIYDILAYIKSESVSPTASAGVNGTNQPNVEAPQNEYSEDDGGAYGQKPSANEDMAEANEYTNIGSEQESGNRNYFANVSVPVLIILGLATLAVVVVMVYVIRATRKLKEKQEA